MRIIEVIAEPDFTLRVTSDNGRVATVDVRPFLHFEAFEPLKDPEEFVRVRNGGYFIEWDCGADLSADSIEAHMNYFV
jgi:hypothetical protein